MKKFSLTGLLALFAVVVSALPIAVMALLVWKTNREISSVSEGQFDFLAAKISRGVCENALKSCEMAVNARANAFRGGREELSAAAAFKTVSVSPERRKLEAVRRVDGMEKKVFEVGVLKLGSAEFQAPVFNSAAAASGNRSGGEALGDETFGDTGIGPAVARIRAEYGLEFAVFIRASAEGDFLKIFDTLRGAGNGCEPGSYIDSDGSDTDAAISKSLLGGRPYSGGISIAGKPYTECFEPLFDASGEVVGALSCYGRNLSVADISEYFSGLAAGKTGYVWAAGMGGGGSASDILTSTGAVAKSGERELLLKVSLRAFSLGESGARTFSADINGEKLVVSSAYLPELGVVVGSVARPEDFSNFYGDIKKQTKKFAMTLLPLGAAMFAFACFAAVLAGRKGANMILKLASAADCAAEFNLSASLCELDRGVLAGGVVNLEIYELGVSMKKMSAEVSSFVGHVGRGARELAERAEKISSAAAELEGGAEYRIRTLSEISSAASDMQKGLDFLSASAREIGAESGTVGIAASETRRRLASLDKIAKSIVADTDSAAGALAIISEGAERMSSSLKELAALSSRTGILSLNALSDAGGEGEVVPGGDPEAFGGDASEIAALSKSSADAAMEAADRISAVCNAASDGVSEMAAYNSAARDGYLSMEELSDIAKSVELRAGRFAPAMLALSGAIDAGVRDMREISESVLKLEGGLKNNLSELGRVKFLAAELKKSSSMLGRKVSLFKL